MRLLPFVPGWSRQDVGCAAKGLHLEVGSSITSSRPAADANFAGEHFSFSLNGRPGQIAWVTTNDRTIGALASLTRIFSHELVESCSDPQFDSVQGATGTCDQPGACEIGDVCQSTGVVGGVLVQSYWSQQDRKCIVPKGIVGGFPAGNAVFVQGRFGTRGNFEMVVPLASGGIAHLDRNNDDPSFPWFGPNIFGADVGVFSAVSLIQSNFGSPGNLEVVAIQDSQLLHFSRDSGPGFHWFGPDPVNPGGKPVPGATGIPSLIQGRFGTRGNFELVVPLADGGLAHYDRNNDDPSFPWFGPNVFANDLGTFGSVSLIQSNFGSPGNLELVANDEGQLVAFFRDSGSAFHWFGPYEITALI